MNYLIGLDIGTSSVKGVLMTEDGSVEKIANRSFVYTKYDNGGIEIDANQFVNDCFVAINELAQGVDGNIIGICASSASGNLVMLDKDNNPSTPVFNWQDTRVTTEADEILGNIDRKDLYKKVGWPFSGNTFPLALLCYVKKHSPQIFENCGKICMSTEYLYYKLTGKWGISPSAGTTFYLIDQAKKEYMQDILNILGISEDKLPPIMPCGSVLGGVTEEASPKCGLAANTPVVLGSFDHPSAARGVGVFDEGQMLLSCGTSWVGFFPVNDRNSIVKTGNLIDPFLSDNGGAWATMVSVPSISERIKLYTEKYIDATSDKYKISSDLASKSVPGANGLSINLVEEPDDSIICNYKKEDIARAIMECSVRLLKEKIDDVKSLGVVTKSAIMVGGPSSDPMYHKIIEQMCGIKVNVVHGENAGAVGAAKIAGIGVGIYKDEKDAHKKCS